ncbi:MAG: arginase [Verrucomicrobia bacterium]|nr:arginase [Verrucomicrobiota bacterium]
MTIFIGLASGLGGRHPGAGEGPPLIQKTLPFSAKWKQMIYPEKETLDKATHISLLNTRLAEETHDAAKNYPFTVVIGGDHSCGIGTWSGIAAAQEEEMALLWLDAHMDCHRPETSETGNIHGMPLASLLGHGSSNFTEILSKKPKIKPENLFLIGVRSYEPPEQELVERLNVRVYYIDEVKEKGLQAIFKEISDYLKNRSLKYGISLDIDFFDPSYMSATGTPEENGLSIDEFLTSYSVFDEYPPIAFEFVEFNPPCDKGESLENVHTVLKRVLENRCESIRTSLLTV